MLCDRKNNQHPSGSFIRDVDMEAAYGWEYSDLGEPDTDEEEAGMTESERAERAYERLVDEDESEEETDMDIALTESMATVVTDKAARAEAELAVAAVNQENVDRALAESMETVVTDEAARAAADSAAAARHQEELERAVAESMATVITNEATSSAAELAASARHQDDLNRAALEYMVLAAMAEDAVVVISSDEE